MLLRDIGRTPSPTNRTNLQDCKLSGPQGQDWHQSETYDEKSDCSEVQGTKDEQAVPTANWNVKSAVRIKPRQDGP